MTPYQRERVRKLQDKLCTKAIRYKGVNEEACRTCESPCGYGVEMLCLIGIEPPKRESGSGHDRSLAQNNRSVRKIIRSMNRGKGR